MVQKQVSIVKSRNDDNGILSDQFSGLPMGPELRGTEKQV